MEILQDDNAGLVVFFDELERFQGLLAVPLWLVVPVDNSGRHPPSQHLTGGFD
ncbi:hypothetical protein D1872_315110 [compost metagenome]